MICKACFGKQWRIQWVRAVVGGPITSGRAHVCDCAGSQAQRTAIAAQGVPAAIRAEIVRRVIVKMADRI